MGKATCKWMNEEGLYFEKCWNGLHLEEEEKEGLEIHECSKLHQEWERRELTIWNGSAEKNVEEK